MLLFAKFFNGYLNYDNHAKIGTLLKKKLSIKNFPHNLQRRGKQKKNRNQTVKKRAKEEEKTFRMKINRLTDNRDFLPPTVSNVPCLYHYHLIILFFTAYFLPNFCYLSQGKVVFENSREIKKKENEQKIEMYFWVSHQVMACKQVYNAVKIYAVLV